MEYEFILISKKKDVFKIIFILDNKKYDAKIYLLENNSGTKYYTFGKSIKSQLYGMLNNDYISFSILLDNNVHLGLGTIMFDALFSFINQLNIQQNNRFKYLIGSIDIGTKQDWKNVINFYLNYKSPYISSRKLLSEGQSISTADDFIKRNVKGNIIFYFSN